MQQYHNPAAAPYHAANGSMPLPPGAVRHSRSASYERPGSAGPPAALHMRRNPSPLDLQGLQQGGLEGRSQALALSSSTPYNWQHRWAWGQA
jgi:hypothetical protein